MVAVFDPLSMPAVGFKTFHDILREGDLSVPI